MKKRILYIHHGSANGGAPLSLISLLNCLDRDKYEPIICSSENDAGVLKLAASHGYRALACNLPNFAHTTLGSYNLLKPSGWQQLFGWFCNYKFAMVCLKELLQNLQPDIVHFNSLTLAPYARVPNKMGIPNIIHVREPIRNGFLGIRRKWLVDCLNRYADHVIAICHDNLDRLKIKYGKGQVIYNPIDFKRFDLNIDKYNARVALNISPDARVTLFAGGSVPYAKGLTEFLKAMALLKKKEPRLVCLMPSFAIPISPRERTWTIKRRIGWILGIYRRQDRQYKLLEQSDLLDSIVRSDFVYDIERWIAASDVVCVPHILPHFSRTVIEAGAMKKPVVSFRIGGISEVVSHRKTGLLAKTGDVKSFAALTHELFSNDDLCKQLGENGYEQARRLFNAEMSAGQVTKIYESFSSSISGIGE